MELTAKQKDAFERFGVRYDERVCASGVEKLIRHAEGRLELAQHGGCFLSRLDRERIVQDIEHLRVLLSVAREEV